ncbi:MAG: alpha-amylase [Clostridia bacterium]|nr:alpha-amylase [Clostridia bacterium]
MKRLMALLLALMCLWGSACAEWPMEDSYNWYEVFVYSYQDSNGDGVGDLPGLISRLDYIRDMGYTGLWLMPIMPSPSYHKYDVTDYMSVDPLYGTVEDFKALVKGCHERGIRIIIDLPVNHSSTQHPWFRAACEALQQGDTANPYVDYYCFSQTAGDKKVQVPGTDWYYEEQFAGGGMPDLNLHSDAVMAEIRAIMAFWLQECGADGFRLDAVTSFVTGDVAANVAVLDQLKAMAEEAKPGSYLVGEAWVGMSALAGYCESAVDSFFLFPASQAEGFIVRSLLGRSPNATKYVSGLEEALGAIPSHSVLAPFLCNHDTGRTIGLLQARKLPERAKFAQGVLGMLPGNVFTYYGDEIGMVGAGDDPNKRLAMYWNDGDMTSQPPGVTKLEYAYPCADDQLADPSSLLNYCRAVNHVRLAEPLIARGGNSFVFSDKNLVLMKREMDDQRCYIALNFSRTDALTLELPETEMTITAELQVGADKAVLEGAALTLPPYAIVILK